MTLRVTDVAPDWGRLLDDLQERGMTYAEIGAAMGLTMVSRSMLLAWRTGRVQPMYWRGDALVRCWCDRMGLSREEVPTVAVQSGRWADRHRKSDAMARAMRGAVALPQWPPVAQPSVKSIGKRRSRRGVA